VAQITHHHPGIGGKGTGDTQGNVVGTAPSTVSKDEQGWMDGAFFLIVNCQVEPEVTEMTQCRTRAASGRVGNASFPPHTAHRTPHKKPKVTLLVNSTKCKQEGVLNQVRIYFILLIFLIQDNARILSKSNGLVARIFSFSFFV